MTESQRSLSSSLTELTAHIVQRNGRLFAQDGSVSLSSAFQSIYGLHHGGVMGYEAFARAYDNRGNYISPFQLFSDTRAVTTFRLDQLCRLLHLRSFAAIAGGDNGWLFLNLHPVTFLQSEADVQFFDELLKRYNFPADRVVLEILESTFIEEPHFEDHINRFRGLGCKIAIDDFGSGHSNFNRLWRIKPDFVKLDAAMLRQATGDENIARSLACVVSLLHENRCIVVSEGIETAEQAVLAMQAEVDLAQGYFFTEPFDMKGPFTEDTSRLQGLRRRVTDRSIAQAKSSRKTLRPYLDRFLDCARALEAGAAMGSGCERMCALPHVIRCYLINAEGEHRSKNLQSPKYLHKVPEKLKAFTGKTNACWSHRGYFRRALADKGVAQISRPYLSIMDSVMCVTLSIAIDIKGSQAVLCCDLDADVMPSIRLDHCEYTESPAATV